MTNKQLDSILQTLVGQCNLTRTTEARTANMVLPQWGVKRFYETFVRKQTAVHLLNFDAKNPPLRQYPNRYKQA